MISWLIVSTAVFASPWCHWSCWSILYVGFLDQSLAEEKTMTHLQETLINRLLFNQSLQVFNMVCFMRRFIPADPANPRET